MWITHVGAKFRHGLLEKSLNEIFWRNVLEFFFSVRGGKREEALEQVGREGRFFIENRGMGGGYPRRRPAGGNRCRKD